jgi:hypothetical protein
MPAKSIATIATMGIDIGKNSFHVVRLDQHGAARHPRQGWAGKILPIRSILLPLLIAITFNNRFGLSRQHGSTREWPMPMETLAGSFRCLYGSAVEEVPRCA